MKVLHCSWVPESTDDFIQGGDFWLWVEDDVVREGLSPLQHPRHLPKIDLIEFLERMLGLSISAYERRFHFGVQSVALPTVLYCPCPAPEFERDHEAPPEEAALGLYEVDAYRQVRPISQLGDLRFWPFVVVLRSGPAQIFSFGITLARTSSRSFCAIAIFQAFFIAPWNLKVMSCTPVGRLCLMIMTTSSKRPYC